MQFSKLFKGLLAAAAVAVVMVQPAAAQTNSNIPREVVNNVVQNIIQNVRDQIQQRKIVSRSGVMRFSGETSDFDGRDPFASNGISDPFSALAYAKAPYTKAPALAAPPVATWLYGANLVGSGDKGTTLGTETSVATVTGAFDVTKIGIFTATDALTFIGTGSHTWSHAFTGGTAFAGPFVFDGSVPSTSGTLSYINGGFSADFTALASWTRTSTNLAIVGGIPDASSAAYTLNGQYRFDFPYTVWIEPTAGVTYTEAYTANFGSKTGETTEVHGGARAGFETKWMGFTIQPTVSGQVFKIVDISGFGAGSVDGAYGGRGSGKITVLWTPQFSSFIEIHASGTTLPKTGLALGTSGTQVVGTQAGLRYTW
ncbi:hypothetical protein JQ607_04900 [Bradyrhizobium liaoningense]|uniref:hypothetical protein n=1 Tax=Bradyrhizobium liaoningense TaxID=43992 RepID=UPI001BA623FC|nr:hypothetical protein [Bradyrhizobium liaoningense]MBR0839525.1 hypothetical protein [Bradyrhizobium liaoningense]